MLQTLARALLESRLRGTTRAVLALSQFAPSLQSISINLPYGVLYADMRVASAHGLLRGEVDEANEQAVMRRFVGPGSVALDIGAHIGIHTLLLSHLVGGTGKVFAFEPNHAVLHALRQTVATLANVELHECALSDEEGAAQLFAPPNPSMASLANWTGESTTKSICQMRTLDKIGLPQPDFIKCDIEGAESLALRGGVEMINRKDGPVILFESSPRAAAGFSLPATATADFLRKLPAPQYRIFAIQEDAALSLEFNSQHHVNLLAIPAARLPL